MLSKRNAIIVAVLIALVGTVSLGTLASRKAHAQDAAATPSPTPEVVDQHFLVVPDVAPSELQEELKKLNKQGYKVTTAEMLVVNDKITIVVTDTELQSDDEDEDGN